MKKFKFYLTVLLLLSLVATGCASQATTPEEAVEEVVEEVVETPAEVPSIAVVLTGPINDMDWNAGGYDGVTRIEEQYGAEISFAENVAQSDFEEMMRNYAEAGFDIVVGHSGMFQDSILAVADYYPDTLFICVNGTETRDNVVGIKVSQNESGFLMGAAAAMLSETETVGVIGSVDIRPVRLAVDGFALGAEYVKPGIEVLSTMTGAWEDAVKAKEIAYSMIENNADLIANYTGIAGVSIINAGQEKGIQVIGAGKEQYSIAPDTVPAIVVIDTARLFTFAYEKVLDDSLESAIYELGVKEDAIYYEIMDQGVEDQIGSDMEAIQAAIMDGSAVTMNGE